MLRKGPLSLALVITDKARCGLPLDPEALLTPQGGQVSGLSGSAIQKVLSRHGITRTLSREGARTSRGSIALMREYVALLNAMQTEAPLDLDEVEGWWVERVRQYFSQQPLRLRLDPSQAVSATISALLTQAAERQAEGSGTTYLGTVLQQLVGAKLQVLTEGAVEHHGAAVADESTGRRADFTLWDVAIHVTTGPNEALMRKCSGNIEDGLRPVIITLHNKVQMAMGLAEQAGLGQRVDVFNAEQFLAGNLYELGRFQRTGREATAREIIAAYNDIIDKHEHDPSLRIEVPQ